MYEKARWEEGTMKSSNKMVEMSSPAHNLAGL